MFALVTPLFSPFFRARRLLKYVVNEEGTTEYDEETQPAAKAVPISIVIVEHDSAFRLEQILPKYLSQEYSADYQVVVVIDENDSESEDVLKRLNDNPHLYYTKLPITSRYLSRKKLGITLGMRAAKYDWVVVTDVHCVPTSNQWLNHFAKCCTEDKNLVLGMTPFEDEAPVYQRFNHLRTMLYHLRQAEKSIAFSTNQSMVAIRKSEFFKQKGFSGNLEYTRAEFEFLVNKFAEKRKTAIAIAPGAWLQQFNPNKKRLMGRQLFSLDAMKGMKRKGWFKFWSYLDNDLIHVFNIVMMFCIVIACLCIWHESEKIPVNPDVMMFCYIMLAVFVVIWLISQIVRFFIYRPVLKAFTITNSDYEDYSYINPFLAIILEWTMTFRNIALAIRYRFADKNDFITHKL
ncbi:MAG: glycosyltransferase [Prevotella sp.]|nr:glycosyltransferase [Candidatus Prevotella equi]